MKRTCIQRCAIDSRKKAFCVRAFKSIKTTHVPSSVAKAQKIQHFERIAEKIAEKITHEHLKFLLLNLEKFDPQIHHILALAIISRQKQNDTFHTSSIIWIHMWQCLRVCVQVGLYCISFRSFTHSSNRCMVAMHENLDTKYKTTQKAVKSICVYHMAEIKLNTCMLGRNGS